MFALPDAQTVRDLEAAAAYLRALPGASGKVGCIGFCSGGRQTLLAACSSSSFDAAADCWGGYITRANEEALTTPNRPVPVIDLVPKLACPLYVAIGEKDTNPSPEVGRELEQALKRAGKAFDMKVFPNAGHAFLADYRKSYNEEQAFALWRDVTAFFGKHLAS